MKQSRRENIFYLGIILLAGVVVALAAILSAHFTPTSAGATEGSVASYFATFLHFVKKHIISEFGLLLLQIIIILIFARFVAWLFTKMGQPSVIGEIIAGIILGPSVFGLVAPGAFESIFPTESLGNISLLSQFGLIFFMFVIGMELDLGEIQKNLKKSLIISHASTIFPFILGVAIAFALYKDYGGEQASPLTFSLFFGISLSVTAFPVLARIIQEQNKMHTRLGMLSMSSAASGDITAWCAVAVIMALAQSGTPGSALFTILFATIYMVVMFRVIRPAFNLIGKAYNTKEVAGKGVIALVFVTLLLSAYATEILGLHALFGAFMAGVVMPDNIKFRHMMTEKVEDVSLAVFLPLFFVSSGLQTEIGLLNTPTHWLITLAITLLAIVGKVWGTYVACRVVGENHRDSTFMGILMNTRGLMELIILSMGLQLGILSPVVYAMLVIMTLVTTFITTPLLDATTAYWKYKDKKAHREPTHKILGAFKVLFSFGRVHTGQLMLHIIDTLFGKNTKAVAVTGMHVTMDSEVSITQAEAFKEEMFSPLHNYSKERGLKLSEIYEVSDNPVQSILRATTAEQATLLLVGASLDLSVLPEDKEVIEMHERYKRKFGKTLSHTTHFFNIAQIFKDKTDLFVQKANTSVGVVINRGLSAPAKSILILEDGRTDCHHSYSLLVQELLKQVPNNTNVDTILLSGEGSQISNATLLPETTLSQATASKYDLLILPYETWQRLTMDSPEFITYIPTTLLLHSRYEKK